MAHSSPDCLRQCGIGQHVRNLKKYLDHIEDSIAYYANAMSPALFAELSGGNPAFLHEHTAFQEDLKKAVCLMAKWLQI